jgi:DNA-binding CsgD family transcriptional regulator
MLNIDRFSDAIALIYDAAMDVERWQDALASIAGNFDSPKAQISFATSVIDSQLFVRLWGFPEMDLSPTSPTFAKYRELTAQDPRLSFVRFKAVHCRQVVSDETLHASEMYKQVLAPAGIEYSMYFQVHIGEEAICVVSVMRGPDQDAFTEENCNDFSRFVPHVHRAIILHDTFSRTRREIEAARAAIDGVPLGMMVVEEDHVVLTNRAARSLLDEGDVVTCLNGQLRAIGAQSDAKLASALRDAHARGGSAVGLRLPAGEGNEIRAVIRPLRPPSAAMLGVQGEAVALYVSDSRKSIETPEELLQQLFGLTNREAAVLRALVQGDDLREIAKRLDIGFQTVKTHIQHIMRATGANRQAELVTLVMSSPTWVAAQIPNKKPHTSSARPRLLE